MAGQTPTEQALIELSPIEAAKPIIAQCRRDIAAAWAQVEAAREALRQTRIVQERWVLPVELSPDVSPELSHDRPRSEGFLMVPALKRRRSHRRSASVS
jgi:hypothetical protein